MVLLEERGRQGGGAQGIGEGGYFLGSRSNSPGITSARGSGATGLSASQIAHSGTAGEEEALPAQGEHEHQLSPAACSVLLPQPGWGSGAGLALEKLEEGSQDEAQQGEGQLGMAEFLQPLITDWPDSTGWSEYASPGVRDCAYELNGSYCAAAARQASCQHMQAAGTCMWVLKG